MYFMHRTEMIQFTKIYFSLFLQLLFTAFILVFLSGAVAVFAENMPDAACKAPTWPCKTVKGTSCIPREKICNNKTECPDASDETPAACTFVGKLPCDSKTYFKCQNANCVNITQKCNGRDDCGDLSDESSTICDKTDNTSPAPKPCDMSANFRCNNGNCILKKLTCDGKDDCGDSSDEDRYNGIQCQTKGYCHHQDQFRCKNDNCVKDESKICDGYDNCGDCSDESPELCHSRGCNTQTHFRCKTGLCVSQSKVHNWWNDCWDWSDESDTFWFSYRRGSCRYCYLGGGWNYQTYC